MISPIRHLYLPAAILLPFLAVMLSGCAAGEGEVEPSDTGSIAALTPDGLPVITDEHRALGREMLLVTGPEDYEAHLIDTMVHLTNWSIRAEFPSASEPQLEAVDALVRETVTAQADEMIDTMGEAYARLFTPEELRQINAFYRTEAGQKITAVFPELMENLQRAQQDYIASLVFTRYSEIQEIMESEADETIGSGHDDDGQESD